MESFPSLIDAKQRLNSDLIILLKSIASKSSYETHDEISTVVRHVEAIITSSTDDYQIHLPSIFPRLQASKLLLCGFKI